ncbi:MAG: ABC transporter ATP-binding protein [Egibacteraceae bacterium]
MQAMIAKRRLRRYRGSPQQNSERGVPARGGSDSTPERAADGAAPTANRLLAQAARRAPGWSAVLVLTMVAGTLASLAFPAVLGAAVDVALQRHAELGVALARLGVVLAVELLVQVLGGLAGAFYGATTIAWLRRRLLGHALALGVPGQRRFASGDVMSRITGDAPGSSQVLPTLVDAAMSVVMAGGAVVALGLIDWRLAVAFLLGLPPTIVVVRVFIVQASELFGAYRRLQAAITARLVDALAGIRTIRASGTAGQEVERIVAPLGELASTGRSLWRAQRQMSWQVGLLMPLLEIIVLAVAGFGLAAGRITPGELLAAVGYVAIALSVYNQIDSLVGTVYARATAARVAEVLAERPPTPAAPAVGLPDGRGALALHGVTVRAGDRLVLDRLDLDVPSGASLAVVGRSGAGKTTLASLIGRLADPDEGAVLLDGVPVAALDPEELGRAVAYAFERPSLLGSSVHDAIAYGRPSASRAEVQRAARAAQADGFVRRLPAGYDTPLAQTPLSGGEAQRLGLARAIAQDSRVLVLDDATSSLDTATEVQVEAALAALLADRTCVVVAHRAATAARADLVAWLDGGRIRALAPHALLWEDPEYRAVFAASPAVLETAAPEVAG